MPTQPSHVPSGNTFIDEITEHLTDFVQRNLMTELALDPSDESLLVSREKVNGHMYHMFKDGQVALPEPVGGRGGQQWWAGLRSGWVGLSSGGRDSAVVGGA